MKKQNLQDPYFIFFSDIMFGFISVGLFYLIKYFRLLDNMFIYVAIMIVLYGIIIISRKAIMFGNLGPSDGFFAVEVIKTDKKAVAWGVFILIIGLTLFVLSLMGLLNL